MTVSVSRHGSAGPDDAAYAGSLGQQLASMVDALERSPDMLDATLMVAQVHVNARLAVDPDASYLPTWEAVVSAMQISSALFATSAPRGSDPVECRISDEIRALAPTGPLSAHTAGNWLTAFYFAIVCRDQARMTMLCNVTLEMLRESPVEYDKFIFHWIDTLQTYWLEQPGLVDKLVAAIEMSHPERAQTTDPESLDRLLFQPISLFHRFIRKDREEFQQTLVEALQQHKAYWSASEDRASSVEGYLALGPLAMACLAYDAQFPLDIESPYIPSELLNRAWLGEFPT
ncbi:immunity 49 family protein [Streptomyces sp. NPDC050418]|uniref:immunity 49 family protein n=1 Tax=Streptomyces sp. NPDC050418 TaxID=3365612 RepID=UPI0037B1F6AA